MSIASRCREIIDVTHAAMSTGRPVPDVAGELDAMEQWLRENGRWGRQEDGWPCPWEQHCRCTHKGCRGGWLNEDSPGATAGGNPSEAAAFRCPECERARALVEQSQAARHNKRNY